MDKARLAEIRARCEAATKGPWEFRQDDTFQLIMPDAEYNKCQMCDEQYYPWTPNRKEDWVFMAHSRQDIPDLLQALSERDAKIQRMREALQGVADLGFDHRAYNCTHNPLQPCDACVVYDKVEKALSDDGEGE